MLSLWATAVLAYILWRTYKVATALQTYKRIPKYYCVADPITALAGLIIPRGWWNPGFSITWNGKETLYTVRSSEVVLVVPVFFGDALLMTSSPEVCKEILNDPTRWSKPERIMGLDVMGKNVIASNPPVWRTHRKIAAPAFDDQAFSDVWEVITTAYNQMMASPDWKSTDVHYVPAFNNITTRIALLAIVKCGFNIPMEWNQDQDDKSGSFDEIAVTLPNSSLRHIAAASEALQRILREKIITKKKELSLELELDGAVSKANKNLFGRFVAASQREGDRGLDASEIMGNLFVFLLAGHDTTAHSMVLTLALLAGQPEDQERVHRHIKSVIGDADPTYDDYSSLAPVQHCLYEAIRLFPAGWITMRLSGMDEVWSAPQLTPTGEDVVVQKGTTVMVDFIGACRNPRHFPSPHDFVPLRWAPSNDPDAPPPPSMDTFLGFSSGPRTCLGKKFASVEAVCFLTLLLRDWKVGVKLAPGESMQAWRKRVLQPELSTALKTGDVPLLLTRRLKR
ncbi:hypothetical protein EIP91_010744 [Steccherinum ochraceum]|uniref:Cytochrome P450-dit2 n=1 Tax=Steccherinum ochraceum TaxID=92696 RepID=A0A4R0RWS0_9APHY|nr:hypothetical protein EIP91_010744 [Steccherinum ochraceum]